MSYKNHTVDNGGATTGYDPAPAIPTGVTEGDMLVCIIQVSHEDNTGNPTAPSGWTLEESGSMPINGMNGIASDSAVWIYTRDGGASASDVTNEGTSPYTWTIAASEEACGVMILTDPAVWGEFAVTASTGSAVTSQNAPSVTTTVADELVFHCAMKDAGVAFTGFPSGDATMANEVFGATSGAGSALGIVREEYASTGATGTKSFSLSSEEAEGYTFSLQPADTDGAGMTLATAQFTQATAAAENPGTFDFEKSLPWGAISLALRQVTGVATKSLSPTSKFDTITTTGTVTVQDAATIDGLTINADVILEDVVDLTDVTINGDLDIETAGTYDFSNVTVTGDTLNNDSGGNVSINASDGSSIPTSEPGTGNGEVDVQNSVAITIHVTDVSGTDIEDARVEVSATETVGTITDGDVLLTGLTNSSGILETTTFNYEVAFDPTGLDIQVKARKATSSPFYKPALFVGTVTTAGYSISRALISDE